MGLTKPTFNAISSNRVLVDGKLQKATVYINNGKISGIKTGEIDPQSHNYGDLCVLPGLVDSHVHLNEPGRTQWEGFESGTKAAAAGGVTTVVDMPLNAIPPTTTVENFELKLAAADGQCWVDTAFWGGLVPDNLEHLVPLLKRGVRGFKGFLIESGVDEFPMVTPAIVKNAMLAVRGMPGVLMFHAELDSCCNNSSENKHGHHSSIDTLSQDSTQYINFLNSRPDKWEVDAINEIVNLGREIPDVKLHIVHLASAEALPLLIQGKADGVPITAETCFHYLTLDSESIPASDTLYKCCPPIRTKSNQDKLWDALQKGHITSIVSDHSPCTPNLKLLDQGDFLKAWGGIASVGLGLTVLFTENKGRLSIPEIMTLTSLQPTIQAGLGHLKGQIKVGLDADFCIFDPEVSWVFEQNLMHFKNKYTPYNGRKVKGRVTETILRGQQIYRYGHAFGTATGKTLTEPRTV